MSQDDIYETSRLQAHTHTAIRATNHDQDVADGSIISGHLTRHWDQRQYCTPLGSPVEGGRYSGDEALQKGV